MTIHLRLDEEKTEALKNYAALKGVTASDIIHEALENWMETKMPARLNALARRTASA